MKKIVALMLTFAMVAALALPIVADVAPAEHYGPSGESDKKLTADGDKGYVDVNYEVSAKWQIVIPDDVVFIETYGLKFLADVEAQQARIPDGQVLTLTVSSENNFEMVDINKSVSPDGAKPDGIDYAIAFIENNFDDGLARVIEWPELPAETYADREDRATAYADYFATAPHQMVSDNPTVLTVVGNGNTIKRVTTTLAFYTAGTDTIGTYKDVLTFTANLTDVTPEEP